MTAQRSKSKHGKSRKPPYPANYGGATPEQVARAVLTYRPDAKPKRAPKPPPV